MVLNTVAVSVVRFFNRALNFSPLKLTQISELSATLAEFADYKDDAGLDCSSYKIQQIVAPNGPVKGRLAMRHIAINR